MYLWSIPHGDLSGLWVYFFLLDGLLSYLRTCKLLRYLRVTLDFLKSAYRLTIWNTTIPVHIILLYAIYTRSSTNTLVCSSIIVNHFCPRLVIDDHSLGFGITECSYTQFYVTSKCCIYIGIDDILCYTWVMLPLFSFFLLF